MINYFSIHGIKLTLEVDNETDAYSFERVILC